MPTTPDLNLDLIIRKQSLMTHFQPVVSIKKKKIIGLEALSRGLDPISGNLVQPCLLFAAAEHFDKTVETDRACRKAALTAFRPVHQQHPDLLLFINFDTSMVDKGIVGSGNFLRMVRDHGIDPRNIVIELVESRVRDFSELCRFISMYREHGFLIALDDFGAGHSNLERVSIIKPDIIKIDRSLIKDIHSQFYKQEIIKAVVKLADQLGVMVLAEGTENPREVLKSLELGTDLFQGYFFARPQNILDVDFDKIEDKIRETGDGFFKCVIKRIKARKQKFSNYQALSFSILSGLSSGQDMDLESQLKKMIKSSKVIECAYVLDESGRQVSPTVVNRGFVRERKSRFLFRPAEKGDDHCLKDYYVYIQAGLDRFITDPYISLATGTLCRTISMTFSTRNGQKHILCLDMREKD
ncbi:EAL domain-containing protein [Desulfonatronovibrio hydrogenovorans]|uniref:EAL domain-containing protein n=1 Tax=Desulfonatronovibrio hydrogenovorans TaxID=53245 RepID=UPI000690899C|nr:EAL domain-containing protein [Desulfonatronovibrio hydrogenovorans]